MGEQTVQLYSVPVLCTLVRARYYSYGTEADYHFWGMQRDDAVRAQAAVQAARGHDWLRQVGRHAA